MILAAGSAVDVYVALCGAMADRLERTRGRQVAYYLRHRQVILEGRRVRRDARAESARKHAERHPPCLRCGDPLLNPVRGRVCGFCVEEERLAA